MQNYGVRVAHYFQIISEGNTTILHFAFCILHFGHRPINNNLSYRKGPDGGQGPVLCNLTAQIGFADLFAGGQLGAGAGKDDAAVFHNVSPIGNGQRLTGVLFHQKDGDAGIVEFLDDIEDLLHQYGRQAHGGFVQHHQPGPAHKRPSYC